MKKRNYSQVWAIKEKNKKIIKEICPNADERAGIYCFTRQSEEGVRFFYCGQALHVLTRCAEHLTGYQHIDMSIKKRKFYSPENPYGWKLFVLEYTDNLDERERYWIMQYINAGAQTLNKTLGGQDSGKVGIGERKPSKGYYDGVRQGEKNTQKFVSKLFEKNLTYGINGTPNKNKEKALSKWESFLKGEDNDER